MNHVEKKKLISKSVNILKNFSLDKEVKLTHVCGTHEMTASRYGLRSILPEKIQIIPGPGCPVCVCPSKEIDLAIELAEEGCIITTFGDMLRVPASKKTLADVKSKGEDIRVIYSPQDAVKIAKKNPGKEIVFLAIGFETSAPMTAATLIGNPPSNFSVISAHRLTVPAMKLLLQEEKRKTQGFICPGHVSTIIGLTPYKPFSEKYRMPCVIAGFEPLDLILAIIKLMEMILEGTIAVKNQYTRVVTEEGNIKAKKLIDKVFCEYTANWRGMGKIPRSGLQIKNNYEKYDALKKFDVEIDDSIDIQPGCRCHEVMLGNILPPQCKLFLRKCTPDHPVGPCMVSHEGTCSIFAKYGSIKPLK